MKINVTKASDSSYENVLDVVSLTEFFHFVNLVGPVIVYDKDSFKKENGYPVVTIYDDYVE